MTALRRGPVSGGARIAAEAALLAAAYVPIALGHARNAALMWVVVAGALAVRLIVLKRPRDAWVLAAGILLGGGSDIATVSRGIYSYTARDILPWAIPAWMLLAWGHVFLFLRSVCSLSPFRATLPARGHFRGGRLLALDGVTAVALKTAFLLSESHPARAALIAAALIVARYSIARPTLADLRLALVAVTIGPWVEGRLIAAGLYEYRAGVLFGVPAWLAEWWLFAIPVLNRVATAVDMRTQERSGIPFGFVHSPEVAHARP